MSISAGSIEAHAQGDQQVGPGDGLVDIGLAMHAHHAQVLGVVLVEHPDAQQGGRDRDAALVDKGPKFLVGVAVLDALPGQDDRPLGL